jgi:hypothetical protein
MTARDQRLEKLNMFLTVPERALLRLRAFKADEPEDPALRRSTPEWQLAEVNQAMRLVNGVHDTVGWYVICLQTRMETLEARHGIVAALSLWSAHAYRMRDALIFDLPEPLTRSEYASRLAGARAELVPLPDLAKLLAEDDDCDDEAAWDAAVARHLAALRVLVEDGTLASAKRHDGEIVVEWGAFCDWRGEEVHVLPEYGTRVSTWPDEAAPLVAQQRATLKALRERCNEAPGLGSGGQVDGLRDMLLGGLCAELGRLWADVLAVEEVLAWATERFSGEEPLHPEGRAMLDGVRAAALQLHEALVVEGREVELPDEPAEDTARLLRRKVEQREEEG